MVNEKTKGVVKYKITICLLSIGIIIAGYLNHYAFLQELTITFMFSFFVQLSFCLMLLEIVINYKKYENPTN